MWPIAPLALSKLRWLLLMGLLGSLLTLLDESPDWHPYVDSKECIPLKSWWKLNFESRVHVMQTCLYEEE